MTLDNAKTRANEISAERLIDVVELADNSGFIARFTSDKGLRVSGHVIALVDHHMITTQTFRRLCNPRAIGPVL